MTAVDELAELEALYHDQPAHAQVRDLARINALRAAGGLPPVDARLRPPAPPEAARRAAEAAARAEEDLALVAEGGRLHALYVAREAELAPHRRYAKAVAEATHSPGKTPVRPLATMGTGGGPLRCDHCGRPVILEGAPYHGWEADRAWADRVGKGISFHDRLHGAGPDTWVSWVHGGMLVDIEVNGTLRIYHGYRGNAGHCLALADAARRAAREAVPPVPAGAKRAVDAYLRHAFPAMPDIERGKLVGDVVGAVYGFDPGVGTNRPEGS